MSKTLPVAPPSLPIEILHGIIALLPPTKCYQLATLFRFINLQHKAMPKTRIPDIDESSYRGLVKLLDLWKAAHTESGVLLEYTNPLDYASSRNHACVLEWWKQSGLELRYTHHAMNIASERGFIDVLQWWKDSGLPLKYTSLGVDFASENGCLHVLNWWKDSGLEIKYSVLAMDLAAWKGNTKVLQWWENSGLEVKWSMYFENEVSKLLYYNGSVGWWGNYGIVKLVWQWKLFLKRKLHEFIWSPRLPKGL